jgi:hypothetical protein
MKAASLIAGRKDSNLHRNFEVSLRKKNREPLLRYDNQAPKKNEGVNGMF